MIIDIAFCIPSVNLCKDRVWIYEAAQLKREVSVGFFKEFFFKTRFASNPKTAFYGCNF